jgi:hypothetical protein
MSLIKLSNGVEISEETVVAALEKAGIETKPKPEHIFEAGDVAYVDGVCEPGNWRLIASIAGKLKSVNQCGWIQGDGTQQYFKNNHYQYYDKQRNLLKY